MKDLIDKIFIPEHQRILDEPSKYSEFEIIDAKRKLKIESDEAERLGITVERLRHERQLSRQEIGAKITEKEKEIEALQNVDLKTFGNTCFRFVFETCNHSGTTFNKDDKKTMDLYREIIRYFHWESDCETLDKNRFLFLFGVYGCGKSMLVKSIYKALQYHRRDNWSYFHLPTLTKNYMAQAQLKDNKENAFEMLFSCTNNMIIDEIGDKSEKQKLYGNEIESVRSLMLDKYDKWISKTRQRVVFTSNLFPSREYFFTQSDSDHRPTLQNFYDDKVQNKMMEICNLVRFPNVSYRINNRVELLG